MTRKLHVFALLAAVLTVAPNVFAVPMTVDAKPFTLVATRPGTQLFGLTSDLQGRVYTGNNSNEPTGIPVQVFDPALFVGGVLPLQNFGPNVGDADGIAFGGGFIYVADFNEGMRRLAVPAATDTLLMPGVAVNDTGSPIVYRPTDGHLFVGLGGLTNIKRIDEYTSTGTFVTSHTTATDVETMTFDPITGLIYYAAFGSAVRSHNPLTGLDLLVGNSSGTIDGGLTFDALSGLLFVGTANGINSGLVETINPITGVTTLFATGFAGSLGILREPISGDLYFLEQNNLYRLPNADVVPEPASLALMLPAALCLLNRRRARHPQR